MDLFIPCTIDLQKHQTTDNKYGLEHINKLLEDELSQLRSLKSEKPKEFVLPTVKSSANKKSTEVEGFEDYQRRVELVRSRDATVGISEEKPLKNMASTIGPFSERSNDYSKDNRVLGKGQMPFFQLSSDGHSLSCRFPRLEKTRTGKGSNIKEMLDDAVGDEQKLCSKKSERSMQLSGKLVSRTGFGVKHDSNSDNSDHEELVNNLKIQNCNISVRRDSLQDLVRGKTQNSLARKNQRSKKTFHLACTRDPRKYKTNDRNEDDCTFCAGSIFLHSRGNRNGDGKSQRMRNRKSQTAEKTSLPRLEKANTEKTKTVRESCERCKRRLEQAEVNRIALATAGGPRKHTADSKNTDVERKTKSRPVTKETVAETPQPVDKKEKVLPLLEYTAYMDQEGSLFLLPGAYTLRNKDYNIWSRYRKSSEEKAFRSQGILTGTTLPHLAR